MKSRIIDSLAELSEGTNESLEKLLLEELPGVPIGSRAKQVLELILHDYSSFSVCTIDSFFQKVMRSLAREIHLPLRFELEMRKDEVIEQITENLLSDVGKDAELAKWLSELVLQKLEDEKSWTIEGDIRFIASQLFREESIADPTLTREKIRILLKKLHDLKKDFETKMKNFGDEAVSVIEQNGFDVSDFYQKERGVAGFFYKIRKNNGAEKYQPNSHVLKAAESVESWFPKKSTKKNELIDLVESRLLKHLQQILKFINEEFPRYSGAIEVLKKIYILGIVNDLHTKLSEYREEKNIVLISDTPKILHSFISTDDAPFIFEKTGNHYKHFLIDEFQDTSSLQWQNLLPLISNSLASGNFSMVVGDAKQSIYRWRGGNMNLLTHEVRKAFKHFDSLISEEALSTNYRSKRNIVDFNNAFFRQLPFVINREFKIGDDSLLHLVYSDELQQNVSEKNNSGGFVQVRFFEDDKEGSRESGVERREMGIGRRKLGVGSSEMGAESLAAGDGSAQTGADERMNENKERISADEMKLLKWKQKALNSMLERIQNLLEQNYSMSDIAILVHWNSEGNEIANFLFDHGITKILSPDSLLLSRSAVIQFLIHVCRFLADNNDQVARSELIYFCAVHLTKEKSNDLHPIFSDLNSISQRSKKRSKGNTLFDVQSLDDTLFNKILPADFTGHLLYLSKLPVYELSEQLIRIFQLNINADAYIQRFQDLVLEYAVKNNSSLTGFLHWWDESETVKNCSVNMPENEDAIRIMTIHKSKGLQFPVVIIPFAEWKLLPDNRDLLWVTSNQEPFHEFGAVPLTPSKKLLETSFHESYRKEVTHAVIDNVNLLYVAFTRAEEQLYIFSPADQENDLTTTGTLISRVLQQNTEWNLSDEKTFTLGKSTDHQKKKNKKKESVMTLSSYPSNRWQGKLSITTHSNDLLSMFQSPGTSKINYGILVHKILAEIQSEKDIDKTISNYYFEGLYSEHEKKKLEEEIRLLFLIPEVKYFFNGDWSVKTEPEIIRPGGEILRPDRGLVKGNKAIVVDFKTGKESAVHTKQINRYAEVLLSMHYVDVEKYLVYVNEKRVKKVT